jgi:hypothetical protein
VGETGRREESGGNDAETKDSRDFGAAGVKRKGGCRALELATRPIMLRLSTDE